MSIQQSWSTTAGSNQTADSGINWREGQSPSTVNNSARAMMAQIKAFQLDTSGALETTGTGTAYALTTNESFTALVDGMMLAFRPNVTNGTDATLNVDSIGAKALCIVGDTALPPNLLTPGAVYTATYISADDVWLVHGVQRQRLTADTTFTVGSGQDFDTLQEAWNYVCTALDLAGFDVTLSLADGTHTGGLDDHSPGEFSIAEKADGISPVGDGKVKLVGNVSSPSSVVVDCSTLGVRVAHSYIEVSGFRLHSAAGSGYGLVAAWAGRLIITGPMVYGDADQHIHASSGGRVVCIDQPYTIDGDADHHWYTDAHGHIRVGSLDSMTITLTGTPAFNISFAHFSDFGLIQCDGTTFSGSATGKRFLGTGVGRIVTGTEDGDHLPGNTDGTLENGASYDSVGVGYGND